MKQLIILTFLIPLISCHLRTDSDKNLDNYNLGLKILETIDSNGEIDYVNAHVFFEQSLQEDSNHIESSYWKMQCELKLGKLDYALKTSKHSINNPKFKNHKLISHFYVTAGLIEKINGNIEISTDYLLTAIEIFNSRIENNVNDTDAIMNKALVLCYMNEKGKAVSFLDSISLDEVNQTILEQFRKDIISFNSEKIMNKLKGDNN
jgi:tetratricopeptide (TPR) repeat protein